MRKLLLGTTAVVGAALIGATTAAAQTAPTVRIGGYFNFQFGFLNDTADRNLPTGARLSRSDFRTDTEIHVFVDAKAANGLTYGARIEFEMDAVGVGGAGTTFNTDEAWGFVSSPTLGALRFGDEDSAAGLIQVRPPTYVGFNGLRANWVRQFGARTMFNPLNDGADNTKIVYLSPQFFGFDFGLSFAPNGGEGEREVLGSSLTAATGALGAGALQRGRTTRENEITGAIRYRATLGGVGIAAGFGFTTASAPRNALVGGVESPLAVRTENPSAFSVGLTASFIGFTLGGEYTWGNYVGSSPGNVGQARGRDGSDHFLLGLSYTFPDLGLTVTGNFGRGTQDTDIPGVRGDHTSRLFGVGATYTVAPGWTVFAYFENVRDTNFPSSGGGLAAGQTRTTDGFVIGTNIAF